MKSLSDSFLINFAKISIPVTIIDLIFLPSIITQHIAGSPVAEVKPSIVKWLSFVVALSLGAVPQPTIFFLPPWAPSLSGLVLHLTSSINTTYSG
jgi:hypothetical protein